MILLLSACLYDRAQFLELSANFTDHDGDGFSVVLGDCDDTDPTINPDILEYCDGIDNDCTGQVDDDAVDILIWFQDRDGDGFGDDRVSKLACAQPIGYVNQAGDCWEGRDWIYPGAPEVCENREDRNCDGVPGWVDADGDSFGSCDDCNDTDADIHPNGIEYCDGVDEDCDGEIDDLAIEEPLWYQDADGDGYRSAEITTLACTQPNGYLPENALEDCDDSLSGVNSGATEVCGDLLDNNCDGMPACQTEGLMSADALLSGENDFGMREITSIEDQDQDGYGDFLVYESTKSQVTIVHGPVAGNIDIDLVNDGHFETVLGDYVWSMALIHDMDGNTADEAMVSILSLDRTGVVYLIDARWQATMDLARDAISSIHDDRIESGLGWGALDMGDVNSDGLRDMALSAPYSRNGYIYTYHGPIVGEQDYSSAQSVITGESVGDQAGSAILYSDVDGDGVGDWVIGAVGQDSAATDAGAVYLMTAGQTALADADQRWTGSTATDAAGSALILAGDADEDGRVDVWVGTRSTRAGANAGAAYLMPMDTASDTLENAATVKIYGEATDDAFSAMRLRAEDMNRDGKEDLVTSAVGYDSGANVDAGKVYMFYAPLAGTLSAGAADAWYDGSAAHASAGFYFDIGDISGEGDQDILLTEWTPLLAILPTTSF